MNEKQKQQFDKWFRIWRSSTEGVKCANNCDLYKAFRAGFMRALTDGRTIFK